MADVVNGLEIRKRLGAATWDVPRLMGPDGFVYRSRDGDGVIIVSGWPEPDGVYWIHASMTRADGVPSYADLAMLHAAVWPAGNSYQCFVPPGDHVNIHARALHLWGRADGARCLPDFGKYGTI
jgi:hypothetical protein